MQLGSDDFTAGGYTAYGGYGGGTSPAYGASPAHGYRCVRRGRT